MTRIDRDSPIPIYHQLKTLLQEQIDHGLWRPGDRIPTERELCQMHGISRSPVRQALRELAYEGVLTRRPGLGTFVNDHATAKPSSGVPIQMMCSDANWSKILERTSQVWNEEHPNKHISFEIKVVNHSQFHNLLSAAVGSGTAPDVAMVDCVWVAGLAQSGFVCALEELGPRWDRADFGKDLYPAFVEANSFDGKLYGLPVKADASLLWYRKDWFAEEGLDLPLDWNELLDVATHFLQPQVQERYGLTYPLAFPGGTAGGEATVYNLMPFVWSAGGEIFDAEAEHVVLDASSTQYALHFLRELVNRHRVSPREVVSYKGDTAPGLFARGKVAMALGGSYEADIIREMSNWDDEDFARRAGCVAPPAAPGSASVSTAGGTSYVILRQCENPTLVLKALKVATDPNVAGDLYCSLLQNSSSRSFDTFLDPKTDALLVRTAKMIASGRARPSIPGYVKISRQLQAMFEEAILDTTPVDEITQRTAAFISVISEKPYS